MIVEANMGEGKTGSGVVFRGDSRVTPIPLGGHLLRAVPRKQLSTRCLLSSWIGLNICRPPTGGWRHRPFLFGARKTLELNDDYETLWERWFDDGHGLARFVTD